MNNSGISETILLKTSDLHKSYQLGRERLEILKGITFEIQKGERLAVMGASGAGKSTLLHVLGGLDRPDHGAVFYEGQDVYKSSAIARNRYRARQVGFVFQSYHLLPELTVLENTILPARTGQYGGTSNAEDRARMLLDEVGLSERLDHLPTELSGGEQQRVSIARALMNEPELVLADEPTGNLDSETGEQVLDYLFRLVHDHAHTLVMVTHNRDLAGRCDRVLFLSDGCLGS